MNGRDFIFLLNEQGYIPTDASRVSVVASIDGYLSVTAEYKAEPANEANTHRIAESELIQLRAIKEVATKITEHLNKGEVDYDLVATLEKIING